MANLFKIEVPQLCNPYEHSEILCYLESITRSALYLAGDDQMRLREMVESDDDLSIEEYNPEDVYEKSYDGLIETVGGYNHTITENGLNIPRIQIVVDEEKSRLLKAGSRYLIYKVVLCDGQK